MKKNLLSALVLTLMSILAYAQPTFELRLENEQFTSATTYQFDVNVYNTQSTSFELRGGTIALFFDSMWIKNGTTFGTLTVTTPSSGLVAGQQASAATFTQKTASAQPYFRKIITTTGAGVSTVVPPNSMVKCFTIVLTNSVAFSTAVPPKFAWKFNAAPAAGFNYTDGSGNNASVVSNTGTAQVIANQAFCYTPIYWNGTTWNTFSQTVTAGSVLTASPTTAQEATIYTGTYSGSVDVRGYTSMSGTTHTMASSESLKVRTELVNNGTLNSSTASIHFLGNVRKQTTNSTIVANNIIINNNKLGLSIGGAMRVNNLLTLTSGKISLSINNLQLGNSATVSGGTDSSYIVTDSTGKLIINNIGTGGRTAAMTFPVGTKTSYNPISFANSSASDSFFVSVDTILVATGSVVTSNAVNRRWNITEGNYTGGVGSTLTGLTLQWNTNDELTSFAASRASSYVANIQNTSVTFPYLNLASTLSGSSPYSRTLTSTVTLNSNYTSFVVGANNTLPISLMTFTGVKKASSVELSWKTASEINAKEFQVERMDNGGNFVQIGTVSAVGNSNKVINYSFVDFAASKQSIRYYRLKMVDFDGRYKYSNTIKIADENAANEVVVYPNPSSDKVSIANSNLNFAAVSFKVMNLTGDVVKVGTASMNEINVSDLAAGMYMLSVIDEANEAVTVKFIKK